MARHDTWFLPRQKRQLTLMIEYVSALNNLVVGKKWSGNHELQYAYEDEISRLGLRSTGNLRAREEDLGGGGVRTTYAQLKTLGLIFEETGTKIVRLTYAGEALISGKQSFVEVMRYQLLRFQYPSNQFYRGNSLVDHRFNVHPFWLLLKLLSDDRISYLTVDEIKKILIVEADSDSEEKYEYLVSRILSYRVLGDEMLGYSLEDKGQVVHFNERGNIISDKFYDIANTFLAYLDSTQYVERYDKKVILSELRRDEVKELVKEQVGFISHPELHENFQRKYGCDRFHASDRRRFDNNSQSTKEIREQRILNAFVMESMQVPIRTISADLIVKLSMSTGYREEQIETVVRRAFPNGALNGFLARYREMAFAGRNEATDFETATRELLDTLFGFKAEHVGPLGNTPDVYMESEEKEYCGIVDNKAYASYSISGDHHRRMVDVYIPKYSNKRFPLRFFAYIAGGFGANINSQIQSIYDETAIPGCAITVDQIIEMVNRNETQPYTHDKIKSIFSVNRRVMVADL